MDIVWQGDDRSSEVVWRGDDRSSEVVWRGDDRGSPLMSRERKKQFHSTRLRLSKNVNV